jgi:hypothetical protein
MGRVQSESIMGALQGMGVSTPSQRKEEQVKAALQGLDYNNPASMMEAARKLLDLGMTAEAQQLVKAAQDAQTTLLTKQEKEAGISSKLAQANYYGAQSQKALAGGGDKQYLIDRQIELLKETYPEGSPEYNTGMANILKANAALNQANIGRINRTGYNTDVNTMLGLGGTSVQNVGAGLTPEASIPQSDINAIQTALQNRLAGQQGKGSGGGTTKEIQNAQRIAELTNKQDTGSITQQEVIELNSLTSPKLTTVGERGNQEASQIYRTSSALSTKVDDISNQLEKLNAEGRLPSGFKGSSLEFIKRALGTEDDASLARIKSAQMTLVNALDMLPPGAASNADMQLVLSAQTGTFANPDVLIKQLKAMKRVSDAVADYNFEKTKYISKNKSELGFDEFYANKVADRNKKQTTNTVKWSDM